MAPPKLNAFGKNFQLAGYQQPGDRKANKQDIPEDKNLSLIDQVPVAIFIEDQLDANRLVNKNQSPLTLSSPTVFHLFAADSVAPDLGFFGELASSSGTVQVGKAALIANFLGGTDFNFEVGNLDPVEHGVTEHDVFTRLGYAAQDMDIGGTNLASQHVGVRVYQMLKSQVTKKLIHSAAEETAPSKPADEKPAGDKPPTSHGPAVVVAQDKAAQKPKKNKDEEFQAEEEDPMNRLTGFLWEISAYNSNSVSNGNGTAITRDAGDFGARVNAYFNGDSFIGLFGFAGRTTVPDSMGNTVNNGYRMFGADLSFNFGRSFEKTPGMKIKEYNLLASYITGKSDNPAGDGNSVNWHGYLVELDKTFGGRAMGAIKYDKVSGGALLNLDANAGLHDNALSFNYTYYARTNFWIGLEYTQDLNRRGNNNALGLVFNFGF